MTWPFGGDFTTTGTPSLTRQPPALPRCTYCPSEARFSIQGWLACDLHHRPLRLRFELWDSARADLQTISEALDGRTR